MTNGVLERRAQSPSDIRQAYFLTPMGRDLYDSLLLAWSWGIRWGAAAPNGPVGLIHSVCGKSMLPTLVCAHCNSELSLHACRHQPGPGAGFEDLEVTRLHRRRQSAGGDAAHSAFDVIDLAGDRWTGMVIATQYFGIHRFDDIQSSLDIATNILTDRLRVLTANGVFERRLYEMSPPRYEYWLTRKGKDLYPHALSLLLWGDRWLAGAAGAPVVVLHNRCDKPIAGRVVCSACNAPLSPDHVLERRGKARARG